jgi:transposase
MHRGDLTDKQWERLRPLLPPQKPWTGKPNLDHRPVINGILWILRTGAPWCDLPARYGRPGTVSSRFYRWSKTGLWDRILAALQAQDDAAGGLNWETHHLDSSVIRAHQHAAGAKGGTPQPRPSAAAKGALAPSSTCAARAVASR